jgi:hypothetical protein
MKYLLNASPVSTFIQNWYGPRNLRRFKVVQKHVETRITSEPGSAHRRNIVFTILRPDIIGKNELKHART